jgi:hypothetical protein
MWKSAAGGEKELCERARAHSTDAGRMHEADTDHTQGEVALRKRRVSQPQ